MTNTVDPEMARKLQERLETELIPKLQNQKIRTRTAVAVSVIALVDRQIGKGEGQLEGEWAKLLQMTHDQPKAQKLVEDLKAAIYKYDEEISTKSRDAEADEPAMRQAASGIIRGAIMAKLKALQDIDREEDAKDAAAAVEAAEAEGLPKAEEPADK